MINNNHEFDYKRQDLKQGQVSLGLKMLNNDFTKSLILEFLNLAMNISVANRCRGLRVLSSIQTDRPPNLRLQHIINIDYNALLVLFIYISLYSVQCSFIYLFRILIRL